MSSQSKELLLASMLSKEVGDLGNKMEFWGMEKFANAGTLWQSAESLSLASVLLSIDVNDVDFLGSEDLQLLYCIGWEFVWGQKPPELVFAKRNRLLEKTSAGGHLTDLELLWVKTIMVDTDMF